MTGIDKSGIYLLYTWLVTNGSVSYRSSIGFKLSYTMSRNGLDVVYDRLKLIRWRPPTEIVKQKAISVDHET